MSAVPIAPRLPAIDWMPLRDQDLPAVAAIEASVYVFPWTLGNFRDSLLSGYHCTGAWIQGELIGYAIVMTALEEAHLLNIAVASRWQGRGVGALFLQHLIEEARKRKMEMLYLEVRPSNTYARRMYDRFGFRELGLRRDYYPAMTGREDALFLGLNLGLNRL
jgi:[ribosomal protein S18]-alanine N-acetyltransferase